jgi:hypothetical protein
MDLIRAGIAVMHGEFVQVPSDMIRGTGVRISIIVKARG